MPARQPKNMKAGGEFGNKINIYITLPTARRDKIFYASGDVRQLTDPLTDFFRFNYLVFDEKVLNM